MHAQLGRAPLVAGVEPMPADVATPCQAAPGPVAPVGTTAGERDVDGGRMILADGCGKAQLDQKTLLWSILQVGE